MSMGHDLPYLKKWDGAKLPLKFGKSLCGIIRVRDYNLTSSFNVGDTAFKFSDGLLVHQDSFDDPARSLLLPGCVSGEIFCTISMLFDGSMVLYKELNSFPEVYINGHRVPSEMQINLNCGDTLVLGSLDFSYIVVNADGDSDEHSQEYKELIDRSPSDLIVYLAKKVPWKMKVVCGLLYCKLR
jgi:hypothetical protein